MGKDKETIGKRFDQLLTGTRFEESKALLGRILELAFVDDLFDKPEDE